MHDVLFIFIRDTQRIYISTYHRQSVADVTLEHIAFGYIFFFFF